MGGQTALNTALSLRRMGVLERYNVEMIGADAHAIDKAEDRSLFREAMQKIGLETPKSMLANATDVKDADRKTHEAERAALQGRSARPISTPRSTRWKPAGTSAKATASSAISATPWRSPPRRSTMSACRPSSARPSPWAAPAAASPTTAPNSTTSSQSGLDASPTTEVLIEESVLGWKEYEMEVVRDKADNCIIVCSIENIDPMGVHTGDSITVAPALTLTDKEYQMMRNASIAVLREIGVETGGSNVQFAVNPADGRLVVIEMNPRVSRSSALASKATGFPIAKIAAKLAVGYTLDELENDITGGATPASFEPIDRLRRHQNPALRLREIPRRRAGADHRHEVGRRGHGHRPHLPGIAAEGAARAGNRPHRPRRDRDPRPRPRCVRSHADDRNAIRAALGTPTPDRLRMVAQAIRMGTSLEDVHAHVQDRPVVPRADRRHHRHGSPHPRARPAAGRRTICAC